MDPAAVGDSPSPRRRYLYYYFEQIGHVSFWWSPVLHFFFDQSLYPTSLFFDEGLVFVGDPLFIYAQTEDV